MRIVSRCESNEPAHAYNPPVTFRIDRRFFLSVAQGLIASLSIAVGYLPIAFSFGLAALQSGLSPAITLLTSLVVYAGASQFILIALLTSGAGWMTTLPTVILMNARHLFYGPALMTRLETKVGKPGTHGQARAVRATPLPAGLLAFGLTDEVFATAMGRLDRIPAATREGWYLGLQLGAYAAWVGGTLAGVSLSTYFHNAPVFIEAALEFVLPALFCALLLESGVRAGAPTILVTSIITVALLSLLPAHHALALGMLAGAGLNAVRRPA